MDDLTRINGIGNATAKKLVAAGIDSFDKLARFGAFPDLADTIEVKADWIEKAREIADAEATKQESPDGGKAEPTGGDADDQPGAAEQPGDAGGATGDGDGGSGPDAETLNSTDTPPIEGQEASGTGNAAGPAASEVDASIAEGAQEEKRQQAELAARDENRFVMPEGMDREAFGQAYPLTDEALSAWHHVDPGQTPIVRIAAKPRTGFRRAGMMHSHEPVDHRIGSFTVEQMEMLLGEARLTVEFV